LFSVLGCKGTKFFRNTTPLLFILTVIPVLFSFFLLLTRLNAESVPFNAKYYEKIVIILKFILFFRFLEVLLHPLNINN